jgi:2-haloacid dehalogenase
MTAPRALAFDVFGTVVDIRGTLVRELSDFGEQHEIAAPWDRFADAWLAGYSQGVQDVNTSGLWKTVDEIVRETLDRLVSTFGLPPIDESDRRELCLAWHRLEPWADSVEGLRHLRAGGLRVVTLANGNVSLLADLSCSAGMVWDEILSAQFVQRYKPDLAVYRMAAAQLRLQPTDILMVAAHKYDLHGAREAGFETAFVWRPLEMGPGGEAEHPEPGDPFDLSVNDFLELARALGA